MNKPAGFAGAFDDMKRAARYSGYMRGVADCLRTLREKNAPLEIQSHLFEVLNAADEEAANRELKK